MIGKRKRPRTEVIPVTFENGYARGWAFGVAEAHKASLDIQLTALVDKLKSTKHKKVMREAWTQGVPPAFSFQAGDVFKSPRPTSGLSWGEELATMRCVVQITEATPDDLATKGIVRFLMIHYVDGVERSRETRTLCQEEFARMLRDGACAL